MADIELAQATVNNKAKLSNIWFIPILAVFIALWMMYSHFNQLGPLVTVSFASASGLEVNKTKVKLRNVEIGKVESIQLNESFDGILVDLRIDKSVAELLVEDTNFWVVRPRIGREGVSGLDTLLSGAYIELSPGKSQTAQRKFDGLDKLPATPIGTPGLHITLENTGFSVFTEGDPIIYRGLEVGKVDSVLFNTHERKVYYKVFIQAPYDELVTENTRFWEINGMELDLSADGIRLETGNFETIMGAGIGFDIPKNHPAGEIVVEQQNFIIYPNSQAINDEINQQSLEFILLFSDSIRGLRPGAPVEYRGVKVGEVLRTDINYKEVVNILDKQSLIPVLISIEPARIGLADTEEGLKQAQAGVLNWIQQGLSGGLELGSLLTGSQYIELEYITKKSRRSQNQLASFDKYQVIPTASNQFEALFSQISTLLAKVNKLPVEGLINETQQTLIAVRHSADNLEKFLGEEQAQAALTTFTQAVKNIDSLVVSLSQGSPTRQLFDKDLQALRKVLEELNPLLIQLNEKPNSLIFSDPTSPEYLPFDADAAKQ